MDNNVIFPNLFIVGAMKAGTTAFYEILDHHNQICMSTIKEPNYYCPDLWGVSAHISYVVNNFSKSNVKSKHNAIIKSDKAYFDLFSKCKDSCLYYGDASPSYLRSEESAEKIFSDSPGSKIIIILRDPIERAWSHYLMEKCESRVPNSFDDLINDEIKFFNKKIITQHGIVDSGLYFRNISRYLERFPKKNIMIIDSAEVFKNLDSLFNKLSFFLGVDKEGFNKKQYSSVNTTVSPRFNFFNKILIKCNLKSFLRLILRQSVIDKFKYIYYKKPPKYTEMSLETFLKLQSFYSDDIKHLSNLLGEGSFTWVDRYIDFKK
jgi:hypothetical protein